MSKTTKRKHVAKEVLDELVLPKNKQKIVRVTCGRGNNLHQVEAENGEKFLVSMPTKFRKNIWIKRGDYVIIEPIEEGEKVKAEIVHILYKEQIKNIKDEGMWPKEFEEQNRKNGKKVVSDNEKASDEDEDDDDDDDDDSDLFVNTNRPANYLYDNSTTEESEDEEET